MDNKKTLKKSITEYSNQPVDFTNPVPEAEKPDGVAPPVVPPIVEEVVVPPKPPTPKVVSKGKRGVCRVKCWVSSQARMYEVGEIAEFAEGEYMPSHFDLVE